MTGFDLPELEFPDVPLRLDRRRVAHFCKESEAGSYSKFFVHIQADSTEDWGFTEIWMEADELKGEAFEWAAQHLAVIYEDDIRDHIVNHLQDAKDQELFDLKSFAMGWA